MFNLTLGTASLGNAYGIYPNNSLSDDKETLEFLKEVERAGIRHFDTAEAYGQSQNILGKYFGLNSIIKISSKINENECLDFNKTINTIQKILIELKQSKLDILYLHNAHPLTTNQAVKILSNLKKCKEIGMFSQIGVSLYELEDIVRISSTYPEVTAIQIPENICDRRLSDSKLLIDLKSRGYRLIVRSIFLQGLLLMPIKDLPEMKEEVTETISKLRTYANKNGVTPLDLCLAYAKSLSWMSDLIVGPTNIAQLRHIVESTYVIKSDFESNIPPLPHQILDPRNW